MQFTNTVSSVCGEFTKKLEVIKGNQERKLGVLVTKKIDLLGKVDAVEEKAEAVGVELKAAANAISNIKKLFGEV